MLNLEPERTLLGWLVRHGDLNIDNKWDGWGNFDLSDKGREHAERAGQWLSYERIGRMVVSDVPRTLHTAEIIMPMCNVACPYLYADPNLRPLMVAGFTGQEKTPERIAEFKYYLDHPDIPIPGGESVNQQRDRVQVIAQYLCSPYDGLPTVIVCHNSTMKSFMDKPNIREAISPGGIIAVYMNAKGDLEFEPVLGQVEEEQGVS